MIVAVAADDGMTTRTVAGFGEAKRWSCPPPLQLGVASPALLSWGDLLAYGQRPQLFLGWGWTSDPLQNAFPGKEYRLIVLVPPEVDG